MELINKNKPLVTVGIITYNSAKYIFEALESVKNQTYNNIELIISDDCSTDETLEICNKWMLENGDRFVKKNLITVEENTGVAANCNRIINNMNSNWIKLCAGDDLLLPNCIDDNISYVLNNKNVKVLFSQLKVFSWNFDPLKNYPVLPEGRPMNLMDPSFTAEDQYKRLLLSDRITYTPSEFFSKDTFKLVGAFDERIKFIEDYPMWLKSTKAGIKLHFMEKVTCAYRKHDSNLNNMLDFGLFKPQTLKLEQIRKIYVYPNLPWDISGKMSYTHSVSKLIDKFGLNKKTAINSMIYRLFSQYLNPYQYIYSFKKHILKYKNNNFFYAD